MSKTVFIKENSPEIRNKLEKAGFSICICATFKDAIWLDYHPDCDFEYDIHGVGYTDKEAVDFKLSPIERIKKWLSLNWNCSTEREFYDTVEEFLKHYKNRLCPTNHPVLGKIDR